MVFEQPILTPDLSWVMSDFEMKLSNQPVNDKDWEGVAQNLLNWSFYSDPIY